MPEVGPAPYRDRARGGRHCCGLLHTYTNSYRTSSTAVYPPPYCHRISARSPSSPLIHAVEATSVCRAIAGHAQSPNVWNGADLDRCCQLPSRHLDRHDALQSGVFGHPTFPPPAIPKWRPHWWLLGSLLYSSTLPLLSRSNSARRLTILASTRRQSSSALPGGTPHWLHDGTGARA